MTKSFISICIFFSIFSSAELLLEITQGSDNPINLGIYGISNQEKEHSLIKNIIQNDLIRTGEIKFIEGIDIVPLPENEEEFNYSGWKLLGLDYVVIPSIKSPDKNSIEYRYRVFDVSRKREVRSSTVFGLSSNLRQVSHYASDGIYEAITGIEGVASTKLLYVNEISLKNEKSYRLMVSDVDGYNERTLLNSPEPIISPAWSPKGDKVAYVSFETGIANVYIQDLATGDRESVLEQNTQISSPAWSPDGKYLSLTLYQDGNAEIYLLRLRDKTLTRLTNHYSIDTEAIWSPRGNKILFTSGRSGSPQLYEISLRGLRSKPKRITFEGTYNAKGLYLPDANGNIFVHRAKSGSFHIALKYKRENFIRILTEARLDESPSVAPNGNMVVYAISDDNKAKLAILSLNGARFVLPSSQGVVREPAWSGFVR
jgi:TolB protein